MKNKIFNPKKGVAIELAVVALVIVFSLSALIVSLAVMSNSVGKKSLNSLSEKTQLAQIAKSYLDNQNDDGVYTNGSHNIDATDYTVTVSNYNNTDQPQFVFTKNGGKYKLTVIVRPTKDGNGNIINNHIVTWTYSLN